MHEQWSIIPGYSRYEASTLGRIRSVRIVTFTGLGEGPDWHRNKGYRKSGGKILSTQVINSGYLRVHVASKPQGKHTALVHRLVAAAFLGPCPEGFYVNHIDGDKLNNCIDNLEYASPKHNARHAFDAGLNKHRGSGHTHAKLTEELVLKIRLFPPDVSARQIVEEMKLDMQVNAVRGVRSGRSWKHVPMPTQ